MKNKVGMVIAACLILLLTIGGISLLNGTINVSSGTLGTQHSVSPAEGCVAGPGGVPLCP